MTRQSKTLIIAGSNGASRTIVATEFRPFSVAFRAGRPMDETIHEYAAKGEGFAFETTSGGRGYTGWILLWWERGYRVKLFFLRFPTPDMAVARVRQRMSEGDTTCPRPSSVDGSVRDGATSSASTGTWWRFGRFTTIPEPPLSCMRREGPDETAEVGKRRAGEACARPGPRRRRAADGTIGRIKVDGETSS